MPYVKRKMMKLDRDDWISVEHMVGAMLVRAQYTKLVNYYPTSTPANLTLDRLEERVAELQKEKGESWKWIIRKDESGSWDEPNLDLSPIPYYGFGQPLELYVGCNGFLLTVSDTAKVFGLPAMTVAAVKLLLFRDEKVLEELLRRSLLPRKEWESTR